MSICPQRLDGHQGVVKRHLPQILLLVAVTLAVYGEVLSHQFLVNWDDQAYITGNPAIRGFSMQNLKAAFSTYYVGNYAPVQMVSYMLDYTIWGKNPFGYLLANILYHFLSGVLLYFLLIRQGFWKWGAVLGTALFLVHPVQVESVAWMSQRKNLLAMLFCLLASHAYLEYRSKGPGMSRKWYLGSIGFFIISLLSKSVTVIFPLMLLFYDLLVPPTRRRLRDHADKIPYLAAAGVVAVVAMISQSGAHGGGRVGYPEHALLAVPLTMPVLLTEYLKLLTWPVPSQLCGMYFPSFRDSLDPEVLTGLCIVSCLLALGVYLYRNDRTCLFWYLLFFLWLVPVSQIVPLITMMNDRYLYFPMLGIAGIAAYVSDHLHRRSGVDPWRRTLASVTVMTVVILAVLSYQRGRVWRNSISLFSDVVDKYPEQGTAWARLAEGYVATGDLAIARHYYEKAASLGQLDYSAAYNLVQILFEARDYAGAYRHIRAILDGDSPRQGLLLLAEYYYRINDHQESEKLLTQYLAESPGSGHGMFLLGQINLMRGRYESVGELYFKALSSGESHAGVYFSIACAESRQGHVSQALNAMRTAFEKGLTIKDLHDGEWCLDGLRAEPRFQQMIRTYIADERL